MRLFHIQHLFSIFALYYFAWLLFLLCNVGKILFRTQTEEKPLHQLMFTNKEREGGGVKCGKTLPLTSECFLSLFSISACFSTIFYVFLYVFLCLCLYIIFVRLFFSQFSCLYVVRVFENCMLLCVFVSLSFRNLFSVAVVFIVMSFP
jgi:hypothetical protein